MCKQYALNKEHKSQFKNRLVWALLGPLQLLETVLDNGQDPALKLVQNEGLKALDKAIGITK